MIKEGDRFDLLEEDIHGVVTDLFFNPENAEPYAVVVALDNGEWATIDMSKIAKRVLH